MNESISKTIEWVYKTILEPLVKRDSQGKLYISEDDFEKVSSNQLEKNFAEKILNERNVAIIKVIEKKDRPTRVSDFKYGPITEVKQNSVDKPRFAVIEYDERGEIKDADYTKLDEYLEEEFIPANLETKTLKGDKYGAPYLSIQLNKIVKGKFSEDEITHILEYLHDQEIEVRGTSEDLEDKFENYDYHYSRAKNTQTPERISASETLKLFEELEKYTDDITIEEIKKKIEKTNGNSRKKDLEKDLEKEYKKINDSYKRQEIIEKIENGNAKLADWILYKDYKAYGLDFQEWKVVAYEGLFQAIKNFKLEYGCNFSTFAVKVIRNYIEREVAKYYNFPQSNFSHFWYAMRVVEQAYQRKYVPGDKKMLEEIFDLIEYQGLISPKLKEKYLEGQTYFIDETTEDLEPQDLEIETVIDQTELKDKIENVLQTLTKKEAEVIRLRYGLNGENQKTLEETGKELNVSRERIRQIEAKALRKLKHLSRSKMISGYLYDELHSAGPGEYIQGQQGEYIRIPSEYSSIRPKYYESEESESSIKRIANKHNELIYEQLQKDMKEDLEIISSPKEEPTRLALAIINILKGKKKEIPSAIINKLEEEIESLDSSLMKKILKLRLGLSEYPRPLTYKEIEKLSKRDLEVVKAIMRQALKDFKQKEFKPDDIQNNLKPLPLEEPKEEITGITEEIAMENDNQHPVVQEEKELDISASELSELLRNVKSLLEGLNSSKEEKGRKI